MSGLYENKKTLRNLQMMISDIKPKNDESHYYFVTSFPRSDMGKGTLVAQLLATIPDADAIKFDGLLNTNRNGRHTARGHDDFGIYEQFNPNRQWGPEHYLLGGELYREFIDTFGENENLQINPHLSMYVEYRIHKMWCDIGKPKNLIIEIGGVLSDPEVEPIFAPIIQRLTGQGLARTILLAETGYNGEHIKTKSLQDGVKELRKHHITPWLIVARETIDTAGASLTERFEFERVISDKLHAAFNIRFLRVISVPFFRNLNEYTSYVRERFTPIIKPLANAHEIVIATSNEAKYQDFNLYLSDEFNVVKSPTQDIKVDIAEGINSIEDNAIAKARAWAMITGRIAVGDDTGFFIRELNGEPGVALRRWAGELSENATHEDFWNYLRTKTKDIKNLECYFEQCIAVVSPKGEIQLVYSRNEGTLNRDKLEKAYNGSSYPLAAAFESNNRHKTWDEMTDAEKIAFDQPLIQNLKSAIAKVQEG